MTKIKKEIKEYDARVYGPSDCSDSYKMERFRREIESKANYLAGNITERIGQSGLYLIRADGFDNNFHGTIENCLNFIDREISANPLEALTLGIEAEYGSFGSFNNNPLGRVDIDLKNRTVTHDTERCKVGIANHSLRACDGNCSLFQLGEELATYHTERVKIAIAGYAKLDEILKGGSK